jgi:hypothetical protein
MSVSRWQSGSRRSQPSSLSSRIRPIIEVGKTGRLLGDVAAVILHAGPGYGSALPSRPRLSQKSQN